jgi:adenylylsulfate kinase
LITLTAFVSPYRRDRNQARQQIVDHGRKDDFIEVYVNAPLHVCEQRDPKGLYKQARAGQLKGFTGIDDPYEPPDNPQLVLAAGNEGADILAEAVVVHLEAIGKIPKRASTSAP